MGEDVGVEAEEQARLRARSRRQAILLIVLMDLLILFVASTAVVDLRRLQTREGVALRWFQAAVFGDCKDYLAYSVADADDTDSRTEAQLCTDLRRHSPSSQGDSLKSDFRLGQTQGDRVHILLTRAGETKDVVMHVVWREGHWRIARDAITCGSVGCA
jgi:hypothetical protein